LSPNTAAHKQTCNNETEKRKRGKLENATDHRVSLAGNLRILTLSDLLKPFANHELALRIQIPLPQKSAASLGLPHFLVRMSTVHAAKRCLFTVYDFAVPAFVDFAAAMGTDIYTWFDGDGN
jgi:hypothetical protein